MKTVLIIVGAIVAVEAVDVILFAPKFGLLRHKVPALRAKLGITYYSPVVDRIATRLGLA